MIKKIIRKNTVNRDISWMYFNRRILDEAANPDIPLLERLSYLGIYSNNLDEFFQVRVASIRRKVEFEKKVLNTQPDSKRNLKAILKLNEKNTTYFECIFSDLNQELSKENIFLINETQLSDEQAAFVTDFYTEELSNSLYPILISRMNSRPILNDKSIYLAVKISKTDASGKSKRKEIAMIELPTADFPRFIVLPKTDDKTYIIFLDDVIRFCLPRIFSMLNCDKFEAHSIKFTRDAEMDFENDANQGLLDKVSKGVKSRKKGSPIRLVFDRDVPRDMLLFTEKILNIEASDTHVVEGRYHNMRDLMSFPAIGRKDLKFTPQPPLPIKAFDEAESVIHLIRKKDRYLHFPYTSFDNFIRLLRESAINPEVKEIRISLYRLAKNSKVIKALMCAAMNGKKVTAMVELLARFDEASNVSWAKKMKDAGIKVIFGVEGLKVHCKLLHIEARHGNIACIGTGNFHEGTANVYTDFMLMTSHPEIVDEVESVFNFLEQPYHRPSFKHLMVAPMFLRNQLKRLIRTEIENARKGKPAYIYCKVNHIVDEDIIEKLYLASNAGVDVKLLVRGNCSLVTGVKHLSDHIEAYGIIDRYLEHSRILIFANGGEEKYYIGSADWMDRNLNNRVEVYAPVYDVELQQHLKTAVEYGLRDNVKARIVDGTGKNNLREQLDAPFRSQEELYKYYQNV
ncbi:MAG: hypothetical protein RIS29_1777 [Bacteroidota bacterium]